MHSAQGGSLSWTQNSPSVSVMPGACADLQGFQGQKGLPRVLEHSGNAATTLLRLPGGIVKDKALTWLCPLFPLHLAPGSGACNLLGGHPSPPHPLSTPTTNSTRSLQHQMPLQQKPVSSFRNSSASAHILGGVSVGACPSRAQGPTHLVVPREGLRI